MNRFLRLAHFGGLALFLGSIFAFIVASAVIKGADLQTLSAGRKIISAGTDLLTMPGLIAVLLSGLLMGFRRYSLRSRFFQIKLVIGVLLLFNALIVVVPAVHATTDWAIRSASNGHLSPEFEAAYLREEIFGAGNVLAGILAAIVGVWGIGKVQSERKS